MILQFILIDEHLWSLHLSTQVLLPERINDPYFGFLLIQSEVISVLTSFKMGLRYFDVVEYSDISSEEDQLNTLDDVRRSGSQDHVTVELLLYFWDLILYLGYLLVCWLNRNRSWWTILGWTSTNHHCGICDSQGLRPNHQGKVHLPNYDSWREEVQTSHTWVDQGWVWRSPSDI